ncbi:MAG: hypothetical protein WB867_10285 [Candidatus Dormiibacterota bacterium]
MSEMEYRPRQPFVSFAGTTPAVLPIACIDVCPRVADGAVDHIFGTGPRGLA